MGEGLEIKITRIETTLDDFVQEQRRHNTQMWENWNNKTAPILVQSKADHEALVGHIDADNHNKPLDKHKDGHWQFLGYGIGILSVGLALAEFFLHGK